MKKISVSVMIWINQKNEIFLQKRNEDGPLNNFLEFPGGKINDNETPLEAAKREFIEETAFPLSEGYQIRPFKIYQYQYIDRFVEIHTFILKNLKAEKLCYHWYPIIWNEHIIEGSRQIIQDLMKINK